MQVERELFKFYWLRMNAGGMLNTCKSNGNFLSSSGGRVSNA